MGDDEAAQQEEEVDRQMAIVEPGCTIALEPVQQQNRNGRDAPEHVEACEVPARLRQALHGCAVAFAVGLAGWYMNPIALPKPMQRLRSHGESLSSDD